MTIELVEPNKGFAVIEGITSNIDEKKPSANILYFAIIIVVALLILLMADRDEVNTILILLGFAVLVMVIYCTYLIISKSIDYKNQADLRDKHNKVYRKNIN